MKDLLRRNFSFRHKATFSGINIKNIVSMIRNEHAHLFNLYYQVLAERIEEYRCTEAVRAAIVMQLRDAIGVQNIADKQDHITR